jgi:alpha-tubulin suppressor-like RCC1 family protein
MLRSLGLVALLIAVGCTDKLEPIDPQGPEGAPVAVDMDVDVPEDTRTNIRLEAAEEDSDELAFALVDVPSFGTAVLDGRRVEYTPNADYNGDDSFTFTVTDLEGTSEPGTVNITVTPVNDAPVASVSSVWRMVGQTVVLEADVTDVDGDDVTVDWSQSGGPTLDLSDTNAPSFVARAAGAYTFDVTVSDGTEEQDFTVDLNVMDVASGLQHVIAVDARGMVWGWGNDDIYLGPIQGYFGHPSPICLVSGSVPCPQPLDDVSATAASQNLVLVLKRDGTIWGWGSNDYDALGRSDTDVPGRVGLLDDITAISAGDNHYLALDEDGTVWAWGLNDEGQVGNGLVGGEVSVSEAGKVCRAFNGGLCTDELDGIVAISASRDDENSAIALDDQGRLWSWGSSRDGVLGNGCIETDTCTSQPLAQPVCASLDPVTDACVPLTGVRQTVLGGVHGVALLDDGTAVAWGSNNDGALGQGCDLDDESCDIDMSIPVAICAPGATAPCDPLTNIVDVAAGEEQTLLLTATGAVYSVGGNSEGELGNGCDGELNCRDSVSTVEPVCAPGTGLPCDPLTGIAAVRAGGENSYALTTDGRLLGWGYNSDPMMGNIPEGAPFARQVDAATDWLTIEAGNDAALALKTDGSLWSLANTNDYGVGNCDLGTDPDDLDECGETFRPTRLSDGDGTTFSEDWTSVFAGDEHQGAVKTDGSVWAYGNADDGALATATDLPLGLPSRMTESEWASVDAGDQFTVALATDGMLWAWGDGGQGQLGDGLDADSRFPVQVTSTGAATPDTDWVDFVVGDDFVVAQKTDGTLWTWGDGGSGQLASGGTEDLLQPALTLGPEGSPSPTDWTAFTAGTNHAVGVRLGRLWAWGDGSNGELGNNCLLSDTCDFWEDVSTPVPVSGPNGAAALDDWLAVDAGPEHTLALREDGTVYAFGLDDEGALGTGDFEDAGSPTPVCAEWNSLTWVCARPLDGVTHISTADETSFAIRDDGTLWAWGANDDGRLGFGRPEVAFPELVLWNPAGAQD